MKVELTEITAEMTGNEELAKAINTNLKAINDMAEKREMVIFSRLREMQNKTDNRFDKLDAKLELLLGHFEIEIPKDLLTDSNDKK